MRLEGYAAVFNKPSRDLGGFREVIKPGAFRDVLARGEDVLLLVEHEGLPLARRSSGTLELREDHKGLFVSSTLDPSDPDVQRLAPKIRRGDLAGMSFGFKSDHDEWKNGSTPTRIIHEINVLRDVTVTAYAAYPSTSLSLRSLGTGELELEQLRKSNRTKWLDHGLRLVAVA